MPHPALIDPAKDPLQISKAAKFRALLTSGDLGQPQFTRRDLGDARGQRPNICPAKPERCRGEVAPLKEVFALAGNSEMAAAEKRYLSPKTVEAQAGDLAPRVAAPWRA